MKISRFTDSQIMRILKQAEAGYSCLKVQQFATEWLWTYNHERPNMALGGMTPKQKLALAA